jgi:hypothetical protein
VPKHGPLENCKIQAMNVITLVNIQGKPRRGRIRTEIESNKK